MMRRSSGRFDRREQIRAGSLRSVRSGAVRVASLIFLVVNAATQTQAEVSSNLRVPARQSTSQTVAEIAGQRITKEELEAATRSAFGAELRLFEERHLHFLQRRVLDRMVETEVLRLAVEQFLSGEAADVTGLSEDEALTRYLDKEVFSGITVSESEATEYYQSSLDTLLVPMEIELREIVLFVEETERESKRLEKVQLLQRLAKVVEKQPHTFAELARRHSDARSAARGGLRGFVTTSQLEPEVAARVEELAVGEVSEVVSSSQGLHLVRVEERRGNTVPSFDEIRQRITQEVLQEKRNARYQEHIKALRRKFRVIVYYN